MRGLVLAVFLVPGVAWGQPAPAPQAGVPPGAQPAAPTGPDAWLPRGSAELILLDKLRAQPSAVMVRTGQTATFGTLSIALKSCAVRAPDVPQNAAAFLEVTDSRQSAPPFRGWVLSNVPSVSLFEHPVYDLRLVTCR